MTNDHLQLIFSAIIASLFLGCGQADETAINESEQLTGSAEIIAAWTYYGDHSCWYESNKGCWSRIKALKKQDTNYRQNLKAALRRVCMAHPDDLVVELTQTDLDLGGDFDRMISGRKANSIIGACWRLGDAIFEDDPGRAAESNKFFEKACLFAHEDSDGKPRKFSVSKWGCKKIAVAPWDGENRFEEACAGGDLDGCRTLGLYLYNKNVLDERVPQLYRYACDQGHTVSCYTHESWKSAPEYSKRTKAKRGTTENTSRPSAGQSATRQSGPRVPPRAPGARTWPAVGTEWKGRYWCDYEFGYYDSNGDTVLRCYDQSKSHWIARFACHKAGWCYTDNNHP